MSAMQNALKWDPLKSTGGRLEMHPWSDLAVLRELAEKLITLAVTNQVFFLNGDDYAPGHENLAQGLPLSESTMISF